MRWALVLVAGLVAGAARAEDENARKAREELERELNRMVAAPPTKVRVDFEALDEPNYALEDAQFELDGKPLRAPTHDELTREGTHLVWNGDVTPGKHTVHAHVVYANNTSPLITEEGGHKWKVTGDVSFDVHAGIEVQVRVVPLRDATQVDVARRFKLSLPAKPVMLATLDDGSMPEPAARKVPVAVAAAPTAPTTAATQLPAPAPPPPPLVELAAAPPPPAPPTPSLEPTLAVVRPPPAAPTVGTRPAQPRPVLASAQPVGATGLARPDAPPSAAPPAPATAEAGSSPDEEGFPWPAVAGGVVALVAGLGFIARRRARPPSFD
jgi:hypothetical protein